MLRYLVHQRNICDVALYVNSTPSDPVFRSPQRFESHQLIGIKQLPQCSLTDLLSHGRGTEGEEDSCL
jgi:hypothetical protein